MRLKLTSPTTAPASAAGRASPASGRSRASCARRSRSSTRGRRAGGRRANGHRRACARERRLASTSRAARRPTRAAEALNGLLPRDLGVAAGRGGARRVQRPLRRRARARTATASGAAASARRSRSAGRSGIPRPLDLERLRASAAMLVGEHDFRAFTPDRDAAPGVRAHGRGGALGRVRRRSGRVRDHRRRVPAPHGADAGRDDARANAGRVRAAARRRRPGAEGRHDRAAAGGCTSPVGYDA